MISLSVKNLVELKWVTPNAEQMIVEQARVSNPDNANNMETAPKLLRYLIKHKHWSPFQVASMGVTIHTERDISAQILRHKSFEFQEYCLAGNAKITIVSENGIIQKIPIAELYKKWNSPLFKTRNARSYDTSIQRFINAPILSVYESGQKPVYKYTIDTAHSSKTIDCTREHKVLTKEKGFVTFGEAYNQGLTVALNGKETYPLPYQDPKVLEASAWMGSTKFAQEFGIKDVTARKWFRKYGIVPFKLGKAACSDINISFDSKKASFMKWARENILKNECKHCGHDGSTSRLELSHVIAHDGDAQLCFDENNLQTLCAKCHRNYDIQQQGKNYGWSLNLTAKWGKIKTEEYLGVQMTYDIEMDHPTHNFVANGIVVHNSSRYAKMPSYTLPSYRRQDDKNRQNSFDDLSDEVHDALLERTTYLLDQVFAFYDEMLEIGIAKETARRILPLCTSTTLHMTGTLRSWIHYLQVRCDPATQLEHRQIACAIRDIFIQEFPVIGQAVFPEVIYQPSNSTMFF